MGERFMINSVRAQQYDERSMRSGVLRVARGQKSKHFKTFTPRNWRKILWKTALQAPNARKWLKYTDRCRTPQCSIKLQARRTMYLQADVAGYKSLSFMPPT